MKSVAVLCLLLLAPAVAAESAAPASPNTPVEHPANALAGHASPYLAMHGHDPVEWHEWGAAALAKARRENRLLFVSSGYFTCYWCHVLHRESFEDPVIAKLLNRFVAVKVDRELRPGLDALLIDFVEQTRGRAGWPVNVFMTPEGYPLAGFTYMPPEQFSRVLRRVDKRWVADADALRIAARQGFAVLHPEMAGDDALGKAPQQVPEGEQPIDRQALADALLAQIEPYIDDVSGGFGNEQKFPQTPQLSALLRVLDFSRQAASQDAATRMQQAWLREFLILTLEQMANNGLRDHLQGGFFRYSTDPLWQVPHFEKMLYGNAQLAMLYLDAGQMFGRADFTQVGRDTLDFMLDGMRGRQGGFIAALSAVDDAGVEGGYYLWSREQLEALLDGDELELARLAWQLAGDPTTDDKYLPVNGADIEDIARRLEKTVAEVTQMRQRVRQRLLDARKNRGLPPDTKQIAAWNGLALSALARGARLTDAQRYRVAGRQLRDFLVDQLWDGTQLLRARGRDGPVGNASLEDYAYVARGLLDWDESEGTTRDHGRILTMLNIAWQRFHNARGWRLTEQNLLPYDLREPVLGDGPMPSPADILIETTLRLPAGKQSARLHKLAGNALLAGYEESRTAPFFNATRIRLLIDNAPLPRPACRLPGTPCPP